MQLILKSQTLYDNKIVLGNNDKIILIGNNNNM